MTITKNNRINLEINQRLAEICGIHVGDGYLRNDGRRREWDISGSVEERSYYDTNVIPLFNKEFSLNIKGRFFPYRNTYGFVIRDVETIKFAHEVLGFPYGNKSSIISVPNFIFTKPSILKSFLRGYFDTDGHFSCTRNYGPYVAFKKKFHNYPRLQFSTVSYNLSNGLKNVFKILGFKFCFYKCHPKPQTESLKYLYDINGSEMVQKLFRLINPKNQTKASRYIIWKNFGFCPTNINFEQRQSILKGELNPYIFYKGP